MQSGRSDVTELLDAWSDGDAKALDELMPLVVEDLQRMARAYLARERPGHTLEPTALVNELYLRLAGKRTVTWESRTQFFASMAQMMRRILVDHARRKKAAKKGGGTIPVSFDDARDASKTPWQPPTGEELDLVALDDALRSLAGVDLRQSQIVELRYFGGLTIEETARTLDVSPMTVKREWRTARLWLLRELSPE